MRVVEADLWEFHRAGNIIVITTNGTINRRGEVVMGRGIAAQAKLRFPRVPKLIADLVTKVGNIPLHLVNQRLVTFPVKHNWWERADLLLIRESAARLRQLWDLGRRHEMVYMPRPGCGNGGRRWDEVEPILDEFLNDERFMVVDYLG